MASDPLESALRLQLEGDIALQAGDYEARYEDKCAIVEPIQRKMLSNFYGWPLFAAAVLAVFWTVTGFVFREDLTGGIVLSAVVGLITLGFVIAFGGLHVQFAKHKKRPALLRFRHSLIELPQTKQVLNPSDVFALTSIRVPLRRTNTKDGHARTDHCGYLDQIGMIYRGDNGGVAYRPLVTNEPFGLPNLRAALEELCNIQHVKLIHQEHPMERAIDVNELRKVLPRRAFILEPLGLAPRSSEC